ncbi:MAG: hypothetical protein LBS98_00415 [Coriobacteriales bacterium]|nr:hypothetical protein [Coriobacteriales bacterium]
MDKTLVSTHLLHTDYGAKGKLIRIVIEWVVFIAIFLVAKIPSVQSALLGFAESVTVRWVTSSVGFVIGWFWVFIIPLLIGTIVTIVRKQTFNELRIYDTGIGFFNSKNQTERFADYANIQLSLGKMQEGVWIESKAASVKLFEYGWREFSQPDVLRNNLERYGTWS